VDAQQDSAARVEAIRDETQRPAPDLRAALLAVAGAFVATGVLVWAVDIVDDARLVAVALAALLVATGYVVIAARPTARPTGVVLVAAGAGAVPPLLLVDAETSSFTGVLVLMTLLWVGAWLAPLTKGRPFLLGLALAGGWLLLVDATGDDLSPGPFLYRFASNTPAYVSLLVGSALLVVAWASDRRGRAVLATPFVAVGDVAVVVGAAGVMRDLSEAGGSLFVVLVGVGVGLIGHLGARRFTTWLGAAVVAGGIVGLVGSAIGDDPSPSAIASALAIAGAALAGLALLSPQPRTRASGGDDPTASLRSEHDPTPPVATFTEQPPMWAAQWRDDPTGRYRRRWWDGTQWTEHVADDEGRVGTDRLPD
jgi:hypothetical protein